MHYLCTFFALSQFLDGKALKNPHISYVLNRHHSPIAIKKSCNQPSAFPAGGLPDRGNRRRAPHHCD